MRQITYITRDWYQGESSFACQHVTVMTVSMKHFLCNGVSILVIDPMDSAILGMINVNKFHRKSIIYIYDLIKYEMCWDTMSTAPWLYSSSFKIGRHSQWSYTLVGNVGNMLATCCADMSMLANFPDIPFFCRHPFLPFWPFPHVLMSGNDHISIVTQNY